MFVVDVFLAHVVTVGVTLVMNSALAQITTKSSRIVEIALPVHLSLTFLVFFRLKMGREVAVAWFAECLGSPFLPFILPHAVVLTRKM